MAKKYENVEKVKELLDDKQLGQLQKRIFSTEKSLAEILRKLSALEADKAEKEALAREEAARAEAASAVSEPEKAPVVQTPEAEQPQAEQPKAATEEPKPAKSAAKPAAKAPAEPKEEKEAPAPQPKPIPEKAAETAAPEQKPAAGPAEAKKAEGPAKKPLSPAPSAAASAPAAPVASGASVSHSSEGRPVRPAAPAAPRAPRYFRNGQEQGVYIAKPGVDVNAGSAGNSYRPRTDRPARPAPRPAGSARPAGGFQNRPASGGPRGMSAPAPVLPKEKSAPAKKKTFDKTYVEKKPVSKRTLIKQQGMTVEDFDENKTGYRKLRVPKKQKKQEIAAVKIDHAVVTTQEIPLKVLSEKLGISAVEISKRLFKEGIMKSINDSIDYDNAALLAADMGIDLEYKPEKTAEEILQDTVVTEENEGNLVPRAPVVTVMGHVDHGKTSLLDKIRSTSVTAGEAGGITQSIGAYTVTAKGKQITFIDTPGHAAFTAMRARGAQATDIAILVVAADDSVMPQTIEAINHAKAANVPIIVAINKMDKPEADPERVKTDLTKYGIVCEDWGGDTIMCPVSAKTGEGVDELLEMILLQADTMELRANPNRLGRGVIIEAKLDKARGPLATVLMQNGTLHVGDNIIAGLASGRVRALINDRGEKVKEAGPSTPVEIMGFDEVPSAGDEMQAVGDDRLSRQVAEERKAKVKASREATMAKVSLENMFSNMESGKQTTLNLIIKADVQGSVEAVKQAMEKLSSDEVKVHVLHSAAGAITKDDVNLASAFNAIIIGFNIRPDASAREAAEREKVDVRLYTVIYKAIEDMELAMKGLLAPEYREVLLGHAEVRNVFKITGAGVIAGCYVTDGKVQRNAQVRLLRDNVVVFEGKLSSLKHYKEDVKEMAAGFECGMSLEGHNDIKEGDVVECFIMEEIPR